MPVLFDFEVHTPYRLFFNGKVESIILTITDGEIGVYAHHAAFSSPVLSCILHIKDKDGISRPAFITDGILEVKDHKTVLMVDIAEWPEEIDTERARADKQEAEAEIDPDSFKFELERAKARLRRAEFRLKTSELISNLP
jgi:F-type H+-transporting ATPase subunit epsilon